MTFDKLNAALCGANAISALCLISPIFAQSAPVQLPEVSVSASRIEQPVAQTASSVSIITAKEIEAQQRRSFSELLETIPGLHVVQAGGIGGGTSIFMRGTNSNHVKVLIDGIDASNPASVDRTFDFGQLLTADVARVEVLRGPQSGVYGADAIGGVISITTKKGDGPAKIIASVEGGSFGTFNQTLGVSGSTAKLNYSFLIAHTRSTDIPVTPVELLPAGVRVKGNAYDNWTASTRLGAEITDNLSVNFTARYTGAKLKFTGDDFSNYPATPAAAQSGQISKQYYTRAEVLWNVFEGRLKNKFGLSYTAADIKQKDPDLGFGAPDPTSYKGERVKYDWQGELDLTHGQTLIAGLEAENEKLKQTPNRYSNDNRAAYVQLLSKFNDMLFITSNARIDDNDRFGSRTTYRIAPAFHVPNTDTILKASFGTGFKAPTLNQLYVSYPSFGFFANPNLKPETSQGFDAGFEQALLDKRFKFGATYFQNDIKNLITSNATFDSYANIGKAKTYGVESFASLQATQTIKLRGDYTFTEARDEIARIGLLRRPRHKGSLQANWQATDKLMVSATILAVSSFIDGNRNFSVQRLKAPGYQVVNFAVNYEVNKTITAFGRVDNLFNRRYQDPTGFLRPGIGAYAGLKAVY
jgi:vitamin B12 transporter